MRLSERVFLWDISCLTKLLPESRLGYGWTELKKPRIAARLFEFGSPTWARTRDLRINSPSLYQLSYRGIGERAF
jgi:hypothetical protein